MIIQTIWIQIKLDQSHFVSLVAFKIHFNVFLLDERIYVIKYIENAFFFLHCHWQNTKSGSNQGWLAAGPGYWLWKEKLLQARSPRNSTGVASQIHSSFYNSSLIASGSSTVPWCKSPHLPSGSESSDSCCQSRCVEVKFRIEMWLENSLLNCFIKMTVFACDALHSRPG